MKKTYIFSSLLTLLFTVNVSVAQVSKAFVHLADTASIASNVTKIDDSSMNGIAGVFPIFTHNWNPGGGSGVYTDKTMGMWYFNSQNKWTVFTEDISPFIKDTYFNVLVPSTDVKSWKHMATASTITQNFTEIDHPIINGDPNAVVLFTNIWDSIYNDNVCGLFYRTSTQKWCIFYEVGTSIPHKENVAYHIVIADTTHSNYNTLVQTATVANISNNSTRIDHPDLNGNPNAIVFATQLWNPGGGTGIYNNHNIGVYYTGTKWAVYNEDLAAMPVGCGFNLLIYKNSGIGIEDNILANGDINVFPNPVAANGSLTLSLSNAITGDVSVRIIDLKGTTVLETSFEKTSGASQKTISLQNIAVGMYVLEIENNGKIGTQKLIIE